VTDLAEHILHWHLDIVQIDGRGGPALEAHLLFFRAGLQAGISATKKAVNFSAPTLAKMV